MNGGARLADDAQRVMDMMSAERRAAIRDAVQSAINDKAADNPTKARKIFYALGETARNIFGDTYAQTKRDYDRASKDAAK